MKLLIFDTETTGLPLDWKIRPQDKSHNWPHLVSISWIVLETNTNKIESQKTYIIRPIDWIIPEDSVKIHGIAHTFACNYGSPLDQVIKEFFQAECDAYVAHNMKFDENVMMNAVAWDLREKYTFNKPLLCTMRLATSLCKLPFNSGRGYKQPKLSELYEHVFRRKPIMSQLHGSHYDTKILSEIIIASPEIRSGLGLNASAVTNTNESPRIKGSVLTL